MRLIGWGDDLWAEESAGHGQESDIAYIELLSNMAGNAWSMFHFAPLQVHSSSPNWELLSFRHPRPTETRRKILHSVG